jgi:hypothetical protein
MSELMKKTCSMCGGEFEFVCFNVNRRSKDGLHSWCKVCCRRIEKERYKIVHEDKIRAVREWQAKNLIKTKEYKKNWRDKQKSTPPTEGSSLDSAVTPSE